MPAFVVSTIVAVPAAFLAQRIPIFGIGAVVYGWVVAEVALRVGKRRRSLAMQIAAGLAALIGAGIGVWLPVSMFAAMMAAAHPAMGAGLLSMLVWPLAETVIGVAVAVGRVRSF